MKPLSASGQRYQSEPVYRQRRLQHLHLKYPTSLKASALPDKVNGPYTHLFLLLLFFIASVNLGSAQFLELVCIPYAEADFLACSRGADPRYPRLYFQTFDPHPSPRPSHRSVVSFMGKTWQNRRGGCGCLMSTILIGFAETLLVGIWKHMLLY